MVEFFFMDSVPILLLQLLLVIEKISYGFRIISLPVRPFANMTAGHSLTKVLSSFIFAVSAKTPLIVSIIFGLVVLLSIITLTVLEIFICFLQAYILCMLLVLYTKEHSDYSNNSIFVKKTIPSIFESSHIFIVILPFASFLALICFGRFIGVHGAIILSSTFLCSALSLGLFYSIHARRVTARHL